MKEATDGVVGDEIDRQVVCAGVEVLDSCDGRGKRSWVFFLGRVRCVASRFFAIDPLFGRFWRWLGVGVGGFFSGFFTLAHRRKGNLRCPLRLGSKM
jgi:hypothetical protein